MIRPLDSVDAAERDALLAELRVEGRRVLAAAGVAEDRIRFGYGLDARYRGQGNEITIWVGEGDEWPVSHDDVVARFETGVPQDLRLDDSRRRRRGGDVAAVRVRAGGRRRAAAVVRGG